MEIPDSIYDTIIPQLRDKGGLCFFYASWDLILYDSLFLGFIVELKNKKVKRKKRLLNIFSKSLFFMIVCPIFF